MKKSLTKLVMFAGFIIVVIGIIVDSMIAELPATAFSVLELSVVAAILAICFINAKNNVLVNVGYCMAGILGACGLANVITLYSSELKIVTTVGYIVMGVSAVFYLFTTILDFFGFVKKDRSADNDGNIVAVLNMYKEMEKEQVITADEFNDLKAKVLKCTDGEKYSVEDLKKWKKLFDQQIINEEEFASVKSKIFKA